MIPQKTELREVVRETLVEMIDHAPNPRAILDRLAREIETLAPMLAPDASHDEIMAILTSLMSDFQRDDAGPTLQ